MLNTIRSTKYQESISYYTEDIDYCECGEYIAPGVGDRTGTEYDVFFEEGEAGFRFKKVTIHNEYEK